MSALARVVSTLVIAATATACGASRITPRTDPGPVTAALPDFCAAEGVDSDGDGLTDTCERELAARHAPMLMLSATRCTPPAPQWGSGIPGAYLFGVQPVQGAIRLLYLPAYYRDCGWSGAKCLIADCAPHAGDSEIIVLDLMPDESGSWRVGRAFLSAHCFGGIRSDCRWYEDDEMDAFDWINERGGAPIVWVSDGRHANYPTHSACERGHWRIDTCDVDARPYRFPIDVRRNIGSRARPLREPDRRAGCVSGAWTEPGELLLVSPTEIECFWDPDAPFRGWQGAGAGATPYGRYLELLEL